MSGFDLNSVLNQIADLTHSVSFGSGNISGTHTFGNGFSFSLTLPTAVGTENSIANGLNYAQAFLLMYQAISQHPAATAPAK